MKAAIEFGAGGIETSEEDDGGLARRSCREPEAFAELYLRYRGRMHRYVRARVRVEDEALDLTQQVFMTAYDRIDQYVPAKGPFVAWLFGIARHAVSDFLRRRAHAAASWDGWDMHADQNVEREIVDLLDLQRLRGLVAELPAGKRDLLALRFGGELAVPEIAALTGKKPDAVYKQLSRTIEQLRGAFDETD